MVTQEILTSFVERYQCSEQDPLKSFKRIGVEQDDGEIVCELSMRRINFFPLPNETVYKMKQPWFCYVPKSESVDMLEKKIKRCLDTYMSTVRQDRASMTR